MICDFEQWKKIKIVKKKIKQKETVKEYPKKTREKAENIVFFLFLRCS